MTAPPVATEPFHIMTKPIGPICNLNCSYCFYLRKEKYFPQHHRAADFRMDDATLRTYIRNYIAAQPGAEVSFAWQGGEPTLLGLDFFKRVVEYQRQFLPPGKRIHNALQTNGTLLNDAWCRFFAEQRFLIGLSLDGPRELHDRYRVTRGGKPTFDEVMRGLQLLKTHRAEFNTLTVVHRDLAHHPREVYEFLRAQGSGFMQFIPLVERVATGTKELVGPAPLKIWVPQSEVAPWSVEPLQFGLFLSDIFDQWVRRDVGRVYVQTFDVQLGIWAGQGSGLCVFSETCGNALAMEHTGDVYACDHFVFPQFRLGNIHDTPLKDLVESPVQRKFGRDKRDTLPAYCRRCDVRFACNGECPKNRFAITPDGEPGLNYLCPGYKHFLHHIRPAMQTMAQLLRQGRAPAEIMQILAWREGRLSHPPRPLEAPPPRLAPQGVGRNDRCPCGSGRKFKKCCGNAAAISTRGAARELEAAET